MILQNLQCKMLPAIAMLYFVFLVEVAETMTVSCSMGRLCAFGYCPITMSRLFSLVGSDLYLLTS
jgi:hypothetical protein